MRTPILISALFGSLFLATSQAYAHCDSADGPVATAAMSALNSGNVNLVLPYVPEVAEAEIRAAFNQSLAVRGGRRCQGSGRPLLPRDSGQAAQGW